jgi:hypothetical protein
VRYDPNYTGLDAILIGPGMYAALEAAGQRAADWARANAPVGSPPDPHPGRYKASIRVVRATSFRGKRAAVHVVADAPYADQVETKHHVLSRALDAAKE